MRSIRQLIFLFLAAALVSVVSGQVNVEIRLSKKSYLFGEPVPMSVSLTNLTGRQISIAGSVREPWIDFIVESTRSVPMPAARRPEFGAVVIPASKTLARTVDLSQLYSFSELGNYSVYAVVRLPGQRTGGYQSKRHLFTLSSAKPYWTQRVGAPGSRGDSREYRLLQFTGGKKLELYAQVADAGTGRILRTHALGEVLMFRKPTVTVDSALTMHVLSLVTPSIWSHARIGPSGAFIGRDLYKNPEAGFPRLVTLDDGTVHAVGGIPYDPKQIAEDRKKTRKASDRPGM